jgi:hypothetical protein
MQFNTAPHGLFDIAKEPYVRYASSNVQGTVFPADWGVRQIDDESVVISAPIGSHTHQISLDGLPKHDMGMLRLRTAREFGFSLAEIDDVTDAELLARATMISHELDTPLLEGGTPIPERKIVKGQTDTGEDDGWYAIQIK